MNLPVKVTKIDWCGGACPYQIEGNTEDGSYFYLRYRGGRLRAGVAESHNAFWKREWTPENNPYNVIDIQYGHPLDGAVSHDEFMPLLEGKVIFPDGFKMETERYQEPQYDDPRDDSGAAEMEKIS